MNAYHTNGKIYGKKIKMADDEVQMDAPVRNAEYLFRLYSGVDLDSLFVKISSLLQHERPQTRIMAASVLDEHGWFDRLDIENEGPGFQQQQQQGLSVALLCNIIARLITNKKSSKLMSTIVLRYILRFLEPYNQEVAFLVLSRLSSLNENILLSVKNLQTVFRECLARDSITVTLRSSVVSTLIKFMPYLLDRQDFTDLVPYMVQAVSKAVELHEEREAQRTLLENII
nr:hypothetical protein [Tanacetum cinerariifolium]